MKQKLLFFLLLFILGRGISQTDYIEINYYSEIEKAKWYLFKDNDMEAYQIYLKLDQKCELRNFSTYYESENLVILALKFRNFDIAYKYMTILTEKYGYTLSEFEKMDYYSEMQNMDNWDSIVTNLKNIEANFKEDTIIVTDFKRIIEEDQFYRKEPNLNLDLAFKLDSLHFLQLINIISVNGFPLNKNFKYSKTYRTEIESIIGFLMLHFSDSNKVKILELILLDNIRLGYCHPKTYSGLIDKSHLGYTRKMIYGHFTNSLPKDIENFDQLNNRRYKVGLSSFDLELENRKLFLNKVKNNSNQSDNTINILFIGNSLTFYYNMPLELQLMLNESGLDYNVEQITFSGQSLESHLNNIIISSSYNSIKSRLKKQDEITLTEAKIKEKKWDYIIIQTGTKGFLVPEYRKIKIDTNIQKIVNLNQNPSCKFILFYTWPSKNQYPYQVCYPSFIIDENLPEQQFCSPKMNNIIEEKNLIIQSMDTVAAHFNLIKTDHCSIYTQIIIENPEINLYEDEIHPNANGAFLNACIFYKIITKSDPNNLKYNGIIDPQISKFLKSKIQ